MDKEQILVWLEHFIERIEADQGTGKWRLHGPISSREKQALEQALLMLGAPGTTTSDPRPAPRPMDPEVAPETIPAQSEAQAPAAAPSVTLNVRSLELVSPANPEITLCLDFGTAMSKAFAMKGYKRPIELALGKRAGAAGYAVDSSLFIADDGMLFFGPQAVSRGIDAAESGREPFDSPKARLSMGKQGDLDRINLNEKLNPTGLPISEGEMITLFLAYLTDLATSELEALGHSRYSLRRFARPCWPEERNKWAEPLLRKMLAQAQILADTFHDRWTEGIPLAEAKAALSKVKELGAAPEYLLDQGIPEPVAAAASLMVNEDEEGQRELFLVVDVGAGTTDFGLFLLQNNPITGVCQVRIVPGSIEYLPQAGNRVDELLKFYVLASDGIDPASPEGRHNLAYLQSTIRMHKETLFRDGIVEVGLANHTRVIVEREAFMTSDRVKNFTKQLEGKVAAILDSVGEGYLGLMPDGVLKVVLTGGGATLPMVTRLASGVVTAHGRNILRKATPQIPSWIDEGYPQFAPQYPQLAVAIGGANPDLPIMGESFSDFKGLSGPTYVA